MANICVTGIWYQGTQEYLEEAERVMREQGVVQRVKN